MRFQLGIQILLLITAGVIAFAVIKPMFADIRASQNELASYENALQNIGKYNQRLQTLLNQANSITSADRTMLFRYLPEETDAVAISRDITNIVENNNMLLVDISFGDLEPVITTLLPSDTVSFEDPSFYQDPTIYQEGGGASATPKLHAQQFEVSMVGNYDQMKSVLQDFERNNYPLKLIEFGFTLEEESTNLAEYTFTLETYSLPATIE